MVQDVRPTVRVERRELLHLVQEFVLLVQALVVQVLKEVAGVHPWAYQPVLQLVGVQVAILLFQDLLDLGVALFQVRLDLWLGVLPFQGVDLLLVVPVVQAVLLLFQVDHQGFLAVLLPLGLLLVVPEVQFLAFLADLDGLWSDLPEVVALVLVVGAAPVLVAVDSW